MNLPDEVLAILLTLMFFLSGLNKINDFTNVKKGLHSRLQHFRLPSKISALLLVIAILIQLICPILVVFASHDKKYLMFGSYALLILMLFTILATLLYHFPPNGAKYYPFISNVTTLAGLMVFMKYLNR